MQPNPLFLPVFLILTGLGFFAVGLWFAGEHQREAKGLVAGVYVLALALVAAGGFIWLRIG